MDKSNFEKDINVPSKRLDRIDKMEIDLANYEQMERDIEKIIEPYQLNWELDCLSLPSAIQSILERKEQECEELKEQLTILDGEDVVVEITVKQFKEYKKFKQTLTEIKEIAEKIANYYDGDEYELMRKDSEHILQKISECEGNDD